MQTPDQTETTQDFSDLMQDVRSGSEEAIWKLTELYSPHILRAIRSRLPRAIRSKVDSVDLMQTLWASLLLKGSYICRSESPSQLIALLVTAAQRKVYKEHRKYTVCKARDLRREVRFEAAEDLPASTNRHSSHETPEALAAVREQWSVILQSASDRDRRVLELRTRGLTYEEISEEFPEVSARTARRILAGVVEKLTA